MPKQRAIFKQLEIRELDGLVMLGQTVDGEDNIIDISLDQLPDVIRALTSISAEHEAAKGRAKLAECRKVLDGSDTVERPLGAVTPVRPNTGPEAA